MEEKNPKKFKINIHIVFGVAVVVMIAIIVSKFIGFGREVTRDEINQVSIPENPEITVYDYIVPNLAEDDGTFPEDDGVNTVLCLGNSPFSDDRDSADSICNLFAEQSGATVYNCSFPNSNLSACALEYVPTSSPMDALSFYFLTTIFTEGNTEILDQGAEIMGGWSDEIQSTLDTLLSIDFETIDTMFIMYDGSDYLSNRIAYHLDDDVSVDTTAGALTSGVRLIQEHFPWIRIIVLSPTYAYYVDADGNYISSDIAANNTTVYLSTYVLKLAEITYKLSVSYVDVFYGGIHEDIASDYLIDNIHLNQAGRQLVVDHMIYAMETTNYNY